MSRHQITPAWQTSRGPLVQAHGCAAGVPVAGARVYGSTRQNLWSNPPTKTQNGMALTSNADGSLALSGTASEASYFYVDVYCLKPGASYTLSLDSSVNASISVQSYGDSGYIADSVFVAAWSTSASGTVSQDATKFRLMVQVNAGITIDNATVRVMLNEGGEPQPWCPPGLTSVSELGVACAGRNLLSNTFSGIAYAGGAGVSSGTMRIPESLMGETVTASVYKDGAPYESTGAQWAFYMGRGPHGEATDEMVALVPTKRNGVVPFVPGGTFMFYANNSFSSGPCTIDVMLELGSTATPYEPPSVTTTPVDLSGHQLRSLPDGTRDVLTVDGSGAVVMEQALAGQSVAAGGWTLYQSSYGDGTDLYYANVTGPKGIYGDYDQLVCDAYAITNDSLASQPANTVRLSADGTRFYLTVKSGASPVACECVYQIYAPQTVQLEPITPPSIPAADASLWAASDVPCDLEATTWTASGAEHGRQQAAMVKVAQQVRQQAETVAALTTQALEA